MPIILIIGGIIIAGLVAGLLFFSPNSGNDTVVLGDSNNEIEVRVEDVEDINETDPTDEDETTESKAETFRSSGEYLTPARTEHVIDVSLTLENGVVTNSTVLFDGKAEGQYSNDNQARFADAYKTEVIGKSLAEISLSRVGGASLTSRSFNEAVAKIIIDASA